MKKISKLALILCIMLLVPTVVYAISNGVPDEDNHPYVCLVVAEVDGTPLWRGSGSLIAPTIVLTAGHVTDGASGVRVWFDSDLTENPEYPFGGITSIEGKPYTHPDFMIGGSPTLKDWITHDVGIIVLDTPVILDEYAELPELGLVDTLKMKTWVDQVGYGLQYWMGDGKPEFTDDKIRMYAPAQLVTNKNGWSDEFIATTANPAQGKGGSCFGDSGGPVLLEGTNTIIGVISWGVDPNCRSLGYSSRVDTESILDWIYSFMP